MQLFLYADGTVDRLLCPWARRGQNYHGEVQRNQATRIPWTLTVCFDTHLLSAHCAQRNLPGAEDMRLKIVPFFGGQGG